MKARERAMDDSWAQLMSALLELNTAQLELLDAIEETGRRPQWIPEARRRLAALRLWYASPIRDRGSC
jgi:hypothetical protein